jgi:CcmD family protein
METVDTYPALFWGYTMTWSILVVYLLMLGRRVSRLERVIPPDADEPG